MGTLKIDFIRTVRPRRAIAGTILISLLILGISSLLLLNRVRVAIAATEQLREPLAARDIVVACPQLRQSAQAWNQSALLSAPLSPLLRRLAWVPGIGAELRLSPDLIALARGGTNVGAIFCDLVLPAGSSTSSAIQLGEVARRVSDNPRILRTVLREVERANQAWTRIAPHIDESRRLVPYRDQLRSLGMALPEARRAAAAAEHMGEDLGWLLGLDAPRRYLVVVQNPFELRPTGGFIGMVCTMRVADAQATAETCLPGTAYDTPAPPDVMPVPSPYSRYLRLTRYTLRDANWAADFPTTAHRIQQFWELNGQPPVDGVIAADIYALVPLLSASGSVTLDDGTVVDAEQVVDTFLARYYDNNSFRDKEGIGALIPPLLGQLTHTPASALPSTLLAMQTALAERHVFLTFNRPATSAVLAAYGWDGRFQTTRGDTLRIVDADVGYGGVNAFIKRLTAYDVGLDAAGSPVTATLTLTYTNRYSPWAEATTSHGVYGKCVNLDTFELERVLGCHANYVRVYVPAGSRLIDSSGFDETFDPDSRHERVIFGGYFRIDPGEQRVIHLHYRLPDGLAPSLLLEKQGGTLEPPMVISARNATRHAALWTSGRTDLRLRFEHDEEDDTVRVVGPSDDAVAASFSRHAAFMYGLDAWRAGNIELALNTWQNGQAVDRALDHVQAQARLGDREGALLLAEELERVASDGRASFELATLLAAQGASEASGRHFQRAAERSPENPLAVLSWAQQLAGAGQPLPDMSQVRGLSSVVRRWREATYDIEKLGTQRDLAAAIEVLYALTPEDRSLGLRLADLRASTGRPQEARDLLTQLARQSDLWGVLAGARLAQSTNLADAVMRYEQALTLVDGWQAAFNIGEELTRLDNQAGAQRAFEVAASLSSGNLPQNIWPVLARGHFLRQRDPAAARAAYAEAQRLAPESGYPDFYLGEMYLNGGDPAAARPFLEAAVDKDPTVSVFHERLDTALMLLGR